MFFEVSLNINWTPGMTDSIDSGSDVTDDEGSEPVDFCGFRMRFGTLSTLFTAIFVPSAIVDRSMRPRIFGKG